MNSIGKVRKRKKKREEKREKGLRSRKSSCTDAHTVCVFQIYFHEKNKKNQVLSVQIRTSSRVPAQRTRSLRTRWPQLPFPPLISPVGTRAGSQLLGSGIQGFVGLFCCFLFGVLLGFVHIASFVLSAGYTNNARVPRLSRVRRCCWPRDRKSTRLNSSHSTLSRMPSSA